MNIRARHLLVIAVLALGAMSALYGCVYKPDAVVKLEIGGKPSAVSRPPSGGKDNRPTTQPAHRLETGATAPDPVGLEWSEADRRAIDAGLQAIGGAR